MKIVGIVLSGSTTNSIRFQLTELGEEIVVEGTLVIVDVWNGRERILARVDRLTPINELFREGDAWTEARRKLADVSMLRSIGRRYVIAEAYPIGTISNNGLEDVRVPPLPGDNVYMFEKEDELYSLMGMDRDRDGVVWFGSILGYRNMPIPLNVENITMHLGIFGETGSGKSYTVGYLIELLSRIPVSENGRRYEVAMPTIVVDANGDYIDYYKHFLDKGSLGRFDKVYRFVFEISPTKMEPFTRTITISLDEFNARELAEFIMVYRTGGVELNELQVSALERVLREFEDEYSFTELLSYRIDEVYAKLWDLSRGREAAIHPQTARAVKMALDKFYNDVVKHYKLVSKEPTLNTEFIDEITSRPSLVILDFSAEGAPGVPLTLKQLVVGYLARILYRRFTEYKINGDERYLLFVIEEAQNYIPNTRVYPIGWSLAREYLSLIATQGRKFGLCLAIVSQRPSFVDPVVLSMINTWIIHRISPEDVSYVSRVCGGLPPSIERRLTRLGRGVAVIVGQMNMFGVPMLVHVGPRTIPHTMGRTRVVETLLKISNRREGG